MNVSFNSALLLIAQVLALSGGPVALSLSPPDRGTMMLWPISPAAPESSFTVALAAGALPMARGPWPGSLIVTGESAALRRASAGRAMIVIAAPSGACGQDRTGSIR